MADRIQLRRDTKANWESYNPILLEGEPGHVLDYPNLYKMGDGVHAWNDLPYRGYNGSVTSDIQNDENSVPSNAAVYGALKNPSNGFIDNVPLSENHGENDKLIPHNILASELSQIYCNIGEEIPFSLKGYLGNNGLIAYVTESHITTPYIHVEEGDVFTYSGVFMDTALSGLVYGYEEFGAAKTVVLIQTGQQYTDYEFTIPSGVNYIRAWSSKPNVTYNLKKKSSQLNIEIAARKAADTTLQQNIDVLNISKISSIDNGVISDSTPTKVSKAILKVKIYCLDTTVSAQDVGLMYLGIAPNTNVFHFHIKIGGNELIFTKTFESAVSGKQEFNWINEIKNTGNYSIHLIVDLDLLSVYARAEADQIFMPLLIGKDNDYIRLFETLRSSVEITNEINDSVYERLEDYKTIAGSFASYPNAIFMANKVPAEQDGVIDSIKFISASTKNFYIATGKRGSLSGSSNVVITRKMLVTPDGTGIQEKIVNLSISKGELLFFGQANVENDQFPGFTTNAATIAANGGMVFRINSDVEVGQTYESTSDTAFVVNATFKLSQYKFKLREAVDNVVTNYVTLTRNAANFNSIREALDAITNASEMNRYVLVVPNGEYFECDIKGKKWVTIKGESKQGTIIYCDGTSDKLTPDDYYFSDYRGVALNTIPSSQKHIFYLREDVSLENITLRANDCKYTVHFEYNGWTNAKFVNCVFEGYNLLALLGFGLRGVQSCEIDYCTFKKIDGQNGVSAIYSHNWTWEQTTGKGMPLYSGGAKIHVKNCKYLNSGNIWSIGEIASMNTDKLILENCDISGATKTVSFFVEKSNGVPIAKDINGNTITDPLDVPYCMQLMAIKSSGDLITVSQTDRPNYVFEVVN